MTEVFGKLFAVPCNVHVIIHQSNDDPEGNGAETHLPIIVINHENIPSYIMI